MRNLSTTKPPCAPQAQGFLRVLYAALSLERPSALAVAFDGGDPSPGAAADGGAGAEQYAADAAVLRALLAGLRVRQHSEEGEPPAGAFQGRGEMADGGCGGAEALAAAAGAGKSLCAPHRCSLHMATTMPHQPRALRPRRRREGPGLHRGGRGGRQGGGPRRGGAVWGPARVAAGGRRRRGEAWGSAWEGFENSRGGGVAL